MQSERIRIPNTGTLLKISLGLIIVAIISSAFVYADTASVVIDGLSYDIQYTGEGVTITGIDADTNITMPALLISVDVTSDPGVLEIVLERSFFDSKYQGMDDDFFVIADGLDITFDEQKTDTTRILTMELPSGTEDIEIIGSVFGSKEPEPIESDPDPEPVEKEIPAPFVDPTKDPKSYVQRYLNEPAYKEWFEENFPDYTFYEALDITESQFDELVEEITSQTTETPTEEKPVEEKPVEEKPKTECGPGTILQDGVCVLDQRCGPGTVMQDGVCVVVPETSDVTPKESGKELLIALIAGFIVAGTVGLVLALISKASKSKN